MFLPAHTTPEASPTTQVNPNPKDKTHPIADSYVWGKKPPNYNRGIFDARNILSLYPRGLPTSEILQAASRSHSEQSEEKQTCFPVTVPHTTPTDIFARFCPQLPQQRGASKPQPRVKPRRLPALPAGRIPHRALESRRSLAHASAVPVPSSGLRTHLLAEAADLALAQLPALVQLLDPLVQLLGETFLLHDGGGGGLLARRVGPRPGAGEGPTTPGPT